MRLFAMVVAAPLVLMSSGATAQEGKKNKNQAVSFAEDVFPILKANCLECHNSSKKKGKLDLSSYDALKRGGKSGAAFVPGDPAHSLLVSSISDKDPEMPKKKPPLNKEQVDLIAKWIKEGAKNTGEHQANIIGKDGIGKKGNDGNGARGDHGNARTGEVEDGKADRDNGKKADDEEGVKGKKGKRIRGGDDEDDDDDGVRGKSGKRNSRGDDTEDEDSSGRKGRGRRGADD